MPTGIRKTASNPQGRSPAEVQTLLDAVHAAVVDAFNVPERDRYQVVRTPCHWICIHEGKIRNYQIITPTTWNGSPRDSNGRRGHWEESFVGLTVPDLDSPLQLGHIVRSHDACLVCTTHMIRTGQRRNFVPY